MDSMASEPRAMDESPLSRLLWRSKQTSDSIRLVLLKARSATQTSPIECKIIHTRLGEQDYEALSYEWGEASQVAPGQRYPEILLDGSRLRVRENLLLALYYIRIGREESNSYLWIDALCIDQTNDLERGFQVQMMGRIFKTADRVLV
jgi:hypothetical protein